MAAGGRARQSRYTGAILCQGRAGRGRRGRRSAYLSVGDLLVPRALVLRLRRGWVMVLVRLVLVRPPAPFAASVLLSGPPAAAAAATALGAAS